MILLMLSSGVMTKTQIASQLSLSIPTVSQICEELVRDGVVLEAGMQASGGGRRAMGYEVNADCRLAAGIDITRNHVYFCLVNLRGEMKAGERISFPFSNTGRYIDEMLDRFYAFLKDCSADESRLLGTGVSVPGIVDTDRQKVHYSHVLELSGAIALNEMKYTEQVPHNLRLFNDATAACMAERYSKSAPESFVFISLSNTVGGASVINGNIIEGDNGRGGELGHMILVPGGRKCYCGREGHYDPYGSALLLSSETNGSLEEFFGKLVQGDGRIAKVFDEYLHYLSIMIFNQHIATDLPVVLGGYVGCYLKPYIGRIRRLVSEIGIFSEDKDYIFCCSHTLESSAVGAATSFFEDFLNR